MQRTHSRVATTALIALITGSALLGNQLLAQDESRPRSDEKGAAANDHDTAPRFLVSRSTDVGALYMFRNAEQATPTAVRPPPATQPDQTVPPWPGPHWPSSAASLGTIKGVKGQFIALGHVYAPGGKGTVKIYHLSTNGKTLTEVCGLTCSDPAWGLVENFGTSLAVGDATGDGLPDLLVGSNHGAFLFRSKGAWTKQPEFEAELRVLDGPCHPVAFAGDVADDKRGDFLITVSRSDHVHVLPGQDFAANDPPVTHDIVAPDADKTDWFGVGLAGGFDVDQDGKGDFVVTAPYMKNVGRAELASRAYIYLGGGELGSDRTEPMMATIHSPTGPDGGAFGWGVANVGDFTNDQRPDLVFTDLSQRAYVFSLAQMQSDLRLVRDDSGALPPWSTRLQAQRVSPSVFAAYQLPRADQSGALLGLTVVGVAHKTSATRQDILVGHPSLGTNDETGGGPGGAFLLVSPQGRLGAALRHPDLQLADPEPESNGQATRKGFGAVLLPLR